MNGISLTHLNQLQPGILMPLQLVPSSQNLITCSTFHLYLQNFSKSHQGSGAVSKKPVTGVPAENDVSKLLTRFQNTGSIKFVASFDAFVSLGCKTAVSGDEEWILHRMCSNARID